MKTPNFHIMAPPRAGRGLARRFGVYIISYYFRDSASELGKLGRRTSPEFYFMADYRIEGESLLITDFGQTITATLTDDYTGLITNINEEGECVFYKR